MSKPKILLIQPSIFVYGGAERQIVEEANWLTDHNYNVTIMTTECIPEFRKHLKEARVFETSTLENLVNYVKMFKEKYQILHPHNHPAELFNYPNKSLTVWQLNEPPEVVLRGGRLDQTEVEAVNQSVSKIVVISDFEKQRVKAVYGIDAIVNYPGVDYDYFNTSVKTVDKYNLKGNIVLLECGYITWTKNQLKTVETLAEVKKKYPNTKLVLAGFDKDPYAIEVKKKIAELGLQKDVIITGYLNGDEDIRNLMKIADVHLLPTYEQGGWAVAFQSIAAGTPTVVSNRFVGSNLVQQNKLGTVSDFDCFSESVITVLDNLDKAKKATVNNAPWIKNNLSWDSFGKKYDKIFTELWNDE